METTEINKLQGEQECGLMQDKIEENNEANVIDVGNIAKSSNKSIEEAFNFCAYSLYHKDEKSAAQFFSDLKVYEHTLLMEDVEQYVKDESNLIDVLRYVAKAFYHIDLSKDEDANDVKLIDKFCHDAISWYENNGDDCIRINDSNTSDQLRSTIRSNYGIPLDDILLFKRDTSFWSSNDQGLVITNKGIYVVPDNDDKSRNFTIQWQEIERVYYKETIFYFEGHRGGSCTIPWGLFYKGVEHNRELGERLATSLTELANMVDLELNPIELYEQGQVEKALEKCEQWIASNDHEEQCLGHFYKGNVLHSVEENKENADDIDADKMRLALKEYQLALNLCKDPDFQASIQGLMVSVKYYLDDSTTRDSIILSMDTTDDEMRNLAMEMLNKLENDEANREAWDKYTEVKPYKERKFIMPVKDKDIAGCVVENINVFRMSNIPSCINFSIGHPVAGQLYIGHPYNPSLYVPYEQSEDIFFVDKVHELCYLLECLGAEEINITSIKGKSFEELNNTVTNKEGGADIKLVSADGQIQGEKSSQREGSMKTQRTMQLKFDPTKQPYVPEGLIWYEEQPQWKRLVNSRLNGNMLEYNEFVSSSSTNFVSSSEKQSVKANARYLWTKLRVNVEEQTNSQLRETEDTQWRIDVKFRSSTLLTNSSTHNESGKNDVGNALTGNEAKYLEEVQFCIEDNPEIDAVARKFLERLCKMYDISPERAAEIEAMALPQLTEDEQEYVDALKDSLSNGAISDRERRILNRLRTSLNISEERAAELEKSIS